MITFKYIRELFENEKKSRNLQELDNSFLDNIKEYLERKNKLIEKTRTSKTVIDYSIINEVENFKNVLKNLLELRTKKIILMALKDAYIDKNRDNSGMLDFEYKLYRETKSILEENRSLIMELISLKELSLSQEDLSENEGSEKKSSLDEKKENVNVEIEEKDSDSSSEEIVDGMEEQKEEIKISQNLRYMLQAIEDIPSFLGMDKNIYGPYMKGERFVIDPKTAKILINNRKAKVLYEIEINN